MILDISETRTDLWKGASKFKDILSISTGYSQLDQYLPGGGWPLGALTEILIENTEEPPVWLIAPALASLEREKRWQVWIGPNGIPYAPALAKTGIDLSRTLIIHPPTRKDLLWTIEQTLESNICSAVLSWPHKIYGMTSRRLQLAAKNSRSLSLCFCSSSYVQNQTMATLRLLFYPNRQGAKITILKCHGSKPIKTLQLIRND